MKKSERPSNRSTDRPTDHPSDRELSRLCLELAFFLRSGTDPGTGLLLMSEKTDTPALAEELRTMADIVLAGTPLSAAARETAVFPADAAAMMQIGETTGRTEEVMTSLAAYYRSRDLTAETVRSALLYPTILLAVMLGVIVLLLTKVLPVFDDVYAAVGGSLTGAAGVLLTAGQVLRRGMPLLVAGLFAVGTTGVVLWKRGVFRKRLKNHRIAKKFQTARFAKALSMTVASGLSPEEALETAGRILGEDNGRVPDALRLLDDGTPFADALRETELLPPADCRLLDLALTNGSTEDAAREIAEELERDAERLLEQTLSRIEPALVLIASLLVGGILLCVMIPLTGLMAGLG